MLLSRLDLQALRSGATVLGTYHASLSLINPSGTGRSRNLSRYAAGSASTNWVMEDHRLAQTVAYGDLGSENSAPNTAAYERHAEPVIELQLEKAGVRLAYLLDTALK